MPRDRSIGQAVWPLGPSSAWVAGLAILVLLGGCERNVRPRDTERECWDLWECNPGRLCGEMIDCVDFLCRTEDASVLVECPFDECVRDSDCVVAHPFDCCHGCPRVVRRADLTEDPELHCFYAEDATPVDPPLDCRIDCTACSLCFPQPLGAHCDLGACEPVDRGCPSPDPEPATRLNVAQVMASPVTYGGQEVLVEGTLLPGGPLACLDDCPSPRCCYSAMTLDGVVLLEGGPCQLWLGFWLEDRCDDSLESEGPMAGAAYEVWGTARLTGQTDMPIAVEVQGLRLLEPSTQGMAGTFDVIVTQILSDSYDPSCAPPTRAVGDPGRVYLSEAGGVVRVVAPMFDCHVDFLGMAAAGGVFATRVPIDCDECCCDFELEGEITGTRLFGVYTYFDGSCRHAYYFEGVRDPLPHPDPQ